MQIQLTKKSWIFFGEGQYLVRCNKIILIFSSLFNVLNKDLRSRANAISAIFLLFICAYIINILFDPQLLCRKTLKATCPFRQDCFKPENIIWKCMELNRHVSVSYSVPKGEDERDSLLISPNYRPSSFRTCRPSMDASVNFHTKF